ncbi:MAG: hydroxymethylbilane synthase [Propionibacteriaceae bacterium]|nr:hydroxymethylbilane synthase [Propionibacteriaceae bacterium]
MSSPEDGGGGAGQPTVAHEPEGCPLADGEAAPTDDAITVRIGARRSPLAVAQAQWVLDRLTALGARCELVGIDTQGDTDRRHLTEIGGTGVFAMAVRAALIDGSIDVAVHSMKDLPTAPAPGLEIAAVPQREDPRDVLVGCRLADLAEAMVIGTGSPRRQAQLGAYAAKRGLRLEFRPIRGNVDRRLELVRTGAVDATLLAAAGLNRLGRLASLDLPHELLGPEVMLPAAAQGALAVEIATPARPGVREIVARLEHGGTRAQVLAEREFLRVLEAGCLAPVGVLADNGGGHDTTVDLTILAVIGKTLLDNSDSGAATTSLLSVEGSAGTEESVELGARLARSALQRINDDQSSGPAPDLRGTERE